MKPRPGLLGVALVVLAGCAASGSQPDRSTLKAIARLEDTRTIGPKGELLAFLSNSDPGVRAAAATAVGRLRTPNGGPAATAALIALLDDGKESVRAATAFALGMRGDVSASSVLILHGTGPKADGSALVRARLIEAASKLEEPVLLNHYLSALEDSAVEVRLEAAAGTGRWKPESKDASEINSRLAAFVAKEGERRARTYGLFALERRKAKEGREEFLKSAHATDPEERLFAVRGLAALADDPLLVDALVQAAADADWRITVEALRGLGKSSSQPALDAVARAIGSANHHVRAVGLESATAQFAAFCSTGLAWTTEGVGNFEHIWQDPSVAVRCAAIRNAIAQKIEGRRLLAQSTSVHSTATLIRELGRAGLPAELEACLHELDLGAKVQPFLVTEAHMEALAEMKDEQAQAQCMDCLLHCENGPRLAVVSTLLEQETPRVDVQTLTRCYEASTGEIATELHFNLLKLAAKIGGNDAIRLLERGMTDEDAYVRRVAHDELEKLTSKSIAWVDKPVPAVKLAFPGEGRLENVRPHVVIATDKGEMEFELLADEAPQHAFNFIEHADFYKGTTFHRVVSDFVAQGGDARGDGNGGSSCRGDALRHEITPRKYVRGSLGMPRNEDWDSGGSQIFITHRMTPHLDGRYTIFGEMVKGFEVLDALDLDDKILEVRVLR